MLGVCLGRLFRPWGPCQHVQAWRTLRPLHDPSSLPKEVRSPSPRAPRAPVSWLLVGSGSVVPSPCDPPAPRRLRNAPLRMCLTSSWMQLGPGGPVFCGGCSPSRPLHGAQGDVSQPSLWAFGELVTWVLRRAQQVGEGKETR